MSNKKEVRKMFREGVFERDQYTCAWCGMPNDGDNMDAHHITDRSKMPNGGYVLENGISLCKDDCHMDAEKFHITGGKQWTENMHPDDLYKIIGSSLKIAVEMSKRL